MSKDIYSMTGYGFAEGKLGGAILRVDVSSVNHRYIEVDVSLPSHLVPLKPYIKSEVEKNVGRGKVSLSLKVIGDIEAPIIELDTSLALKYVELMKRLQGAMKGGEDLLRFFTPLNLGEFVKLRADLDCFKYLENVKRVVVLAISKMNKMRLKEGSYIKRDHTKRIKHITSLLKEIERHIHRLEDKKKNRIEKMLEGLSSNPFVSQSKKEAVVAAAIEKGDITEEIVRISSHIEQYKDALVNGGMVGKKLDFLIQEMNRETTTLLSKAWDPRIANLAVNIKVELERLKEQAQNIE